jgi:ABC-2 type transport system permease protein
VTATVTGPVTMARTRSITWRQYRTMSKRSILAIARQPALVLPSLIFPLFFAALGTSSFNRATGLPGFPQVDSYLDFALAGTIVQGILFGSTTGAAALATDIETGFFDRLLASPASRLSVLVGRLAGASAFGAFQTAVFTLLLLPFGVSIKSGIAGFTVILIGGALTGLAFGALLAAMALRTGSSEAVQGTFPLLFILLFFSSAFFPRETMSGVYRRIADVNPISYLVEGMRELVLVGFNGKAMAQAILIPSVLCVFATLLALRQLRVRLAAR